MKGSLSRYVATTMVALLVIGLTPVSNADKVWEFDLDSVDIPLLNESPKKQEPQKEDKPQIQQPKEQPTFTTQPPQYHTPTADGKMPKRETPPAKLGNRKNPEPVKKEKPKPEPKPESPKVEEKPKVESKPKPTKPKNNKPKKATPRKESKPKETEVKEPPKMVERVEVEGDIITLDDELDMLFEDNKEEEIKKDKADRRALNSRYNIDVDRTQYQMLSPIETDATGSRKQYITRGEVADILYSTINMDVEKPAGPYMDLTDTIYELPVNVVITRKYMKPMYKTEFGTYHKLEWTELASILNKISAENRRTFNNFSENKSHDFGNIILAYGSPYTNPTKTTVVRAIESKVL